VEKSSGHLVLVVDDQSVNLALSAKILAELQVDVVTAISGEAALKMVETKDISLILLDVQMPEMDGFETADAIRATERGKDIPIIFVTAVGTDVEHIRKGYDSGAVDYLLKPVTPFVLRNKVQIFLDLKEKYDKSESVRVSLEENNRQFKEALENLRLAEGLVPICSWCKNIRRKDGQWESIEDYIGRVSAAEFTHGICPECSRKMKLQIAEERKRRT
jgi:CheY-like chemotaxis protein